MRKLVSATAALVALGSASAFAADLPERMYSKAPTVAAVPSWAGAYIGGNVGYGWGKGNTNFTFIDGVIDHFIGLNPTTLNAKPQGVIGGAQIGYNWQIGSIVTGVEADIQGSGIKRSAIQQPLVVPGNFLSSDSKVSWFGTLRGRLGLTATPGVLLYATGGLAYGDVSSSANVHFFGPVDGSFIDYPASASRIKAGWTAGAGAEWMFARNWSAKIEYLYVDLGSASAVGNETLHFLNIAPGDASVGYTWHTQDHIVRAGVNYHF